MSADNSLVPDVVVPVLVSYTRFLEVRARRLRLAHQLTHPTPEGAIAVAGASGPASDEPRAVAVVRSVDA